MPFTAAHPLAVLPLVRWHRRLGLDPTCLIIGSMAPDFEYFVRGEQVSAISHTLRGLWIWDLPATVMLAVLAHAVVKWPMLLVAPAALTRRAVAVIGAPWRTRWGIAGLASCAVSAVIGSATHVAWDSVTHAKGWGPRSFHALRTPVQLPLIGAVAAHRALQHASTAVGLAVLIVVIVRWSRRAPPIALPDLPRAAARALVAACSLAGVGLMAARLVARHTIDAGDLVVGGISGLLAGTLIASAILFGRGRELARAWAGSARPGGLRRDREVKDPGAAGRLRQ